MEDVLQVEKRDRVGSLASRRLRRNGRVPAVLYGHGKANEHLAIPASQVNTVLRRHVKTVSLSGAVKDTALVSDVQWDALGIEVLHLDLIRVNLKELVEVEVPIHTHGDPAGLREGGVMIDNVHQVEIRCPAGSIPEHLGLDVSELHVGAHLTAGDLELPEGVELLTPPETIVVHMEEPREEEELEGAEEGAEGEPEVIAKGGEKEESEG